MKQAFRNLKNSAVRRNNRRVVAMANFNVYPFEFWSTLPRNEGKNYDEYLSRKNQELAALEKRVK